MFLARVLREPLVHFVLAGGVVFLLLDVATPDAVTVDPATIEIGDEEIAQLRRGHEAVWRRAPTEAELEALVENYIDEEILVREALALGLDQDDAVVRRRLRQKMAFIVASTAGNEEPSEQVLSDYFSENGARYAIPEKVSFQQIFLGQAPDATEVADALERLAAGADPDLLRRPTLLPVSLEEAPLQEVDGVFGSGFFAEFEEVPTGRWSGPIRSGYGQHLIRLADRTEPVVPPLADVRDKVVEDWKRDQADAWIEQAYAELRRRYVVVDNRPGAQ